MELKMYFENNNEIIEMQLPKIETEISDFEDGLCSVKENSIKGMQEMTAHLEDGVFFFQRIENETSRYLKGHNSRGRMKLEALKLRPGQYEVFHYNIERFLRNRGLKNQCRKNARCVGSCSRR